MPTKPEKMSEEEIFNDIYDKIMELAKQNNYLTLELEMQINEVEGDNKDLNEEIGEITKTIKALEQEYEFLEPLLKSVSNQDDFFRGESIYPLAVETYDAIAELKQLAARILDLKKVLTDLKSAKEVCNKEMSKNKKIRVKAEEYLKEFLDIQITLKKYLDTEASDIDLSPKQFIKFLQRFKTAEGKPIFSETEYKPASDIIIWKKERMVERQIALEPAKPIVEESPAIEFHSADFDLTNSAEIDDLLEKSSEEYSVSDSTSDLKPISNPEEQKEFTLSEAGQMLVELGKDYEDVKLCDSALKDFPASRIKTIIRILEEKGINPKEIPVIAFTYSLRQFENYTDVIRIAAEYGVSTKLEKDPVYSYETTEQDLYDRINVVSSYGAKITNSADITRMCKLSNIEDVLASSMELGSDLFVNQITNIPFSKVDLADNRTIFERKQTTSATIKDWFDKGGLVTKLDEVGDYVPMDPNSFAELTDYLEEIAKRSTESSHNGYYSFDGILVPRTRVEQNLRKLVTLSSERKTDVDTILLMSLIYDSARSKEEIEKLSKLIIAPRRGEKLL